MPLWARKRTDKRGSHDAYSHCWGWVVTQIKQIYHFWKKSINSFLGATLSRYPQWERVPGIHVISVKSWVINYTTLYSTSQTSLTNQLPEQCPEFLQFNHLIRLPNCMAFLDSSLLILAFMRSFQLARKMRLDAKSRKKGHHTSTHVQL